MEQGWIKLHRQTLENRFLMTDNNAFNVFIKLLMLANKKNGEYLTGRFALAEIVNLKPNTLYSVLVRLENQHLINITSNNKYSVIRICNWNKYQRDGNSAHNNAATTRQQPDNNAATLNKNVRIKNKEVLVAKATMSRQAATGGLTYKQLFFELAFVLGHSKQIMPLDERIRALRVRLGTFTPDQLRQAAKALAADERMQGDNENGKKWGTIDYLLRNNKNVAKYLEESETHSSPSNLAEELNNGKYL